LHTVETDAIVHEIAFGSVQAIQLDVVVDVVVLPTVEVVVVDYV